MHLSRGAPRIAFALGIIAYGLAVFIDVPALRLLAKPLPAMALAWWTRAAKGAALVTAGLAFSALGDLVLDLGAGTRFFLAGMAAFAVAHVLYVAAFLRRSHRPRLLALVVFLVWAALLLRQLWAGVGALAAPVCAYAALLVAMMWRATAVSLESGRWGLMIGAVLFGLSDSLIAFDRFRAPVPGERWLIMATYWAGQFGIARSFFAEQRRS